MSFHWNRLLAPTGLSMWTPPPPWFPDLTMTVHPYPETSCSQVVFTVGLLPSFMDLVGTETTKNFEVLVVPEHVPPKRISIGLSSKGEEKTVTVPLPLEELPAGTVTPGTWTQSITVILDWLNQIQERSEIKHTVTVQGFCVT